MNSLKMTKKIKVKNIYELKWPKVCAHCGETHGLVNASLLENDFTKKIQKIDPQLEYYVCEKHAKWLPLANLSIDNCSTMTIVRLLSYFSATLFAIFVITLPLQLMYHPMSAVSVPYVLIPFVGYVGFTRFLKTQLPIQKTKYGAKEYVLTFTNADVAESFVLENQKHTIVERLN